MKKTDFKFWYVQRADNIHISECAVRFYEGEYVESEEGMVYRRNKKLDSLSHFSGRAKRLDNNGGETIIYTSEDFGVISTDAELNVFMKKELAKDKSREPINEQKV